MKLIGIVGTALGDRPRVGVDQRYIDYFEQFGNTIIVDSRQDGVIDKLDLLVLPGGPDVNTYRYGQAPERDCGYFSNALDRFDTEVLPRYIEIKMPIFGICRGMQSLNVVFGGNLSQHIDTPTSSDEGEEVHCVKIEENDNFVLCGSNHHQAVNKLGDDLIVTLSGYDIVKYKGRTLPDHQRPLNIEGFRHKSLPIVAHQMHVEKAYSSNTCYQYVNYTNKVIQQLLGI